MPFVDSARVTLRAGKGGNGVVAWRREKFIPKGGPSGGNGGRGGDIYLETDPQTVSLEHFRNRRLLCAGNGMSGGGALKQGKGGQDLVLKVPCGTLIKDASTGEVLRDFTQIGESWKICEGGKGGKGNHCFKSPTHQAPNTCTPGTPGQVMEIELELKLIADVGLIGFPNAGKSTLMSRLTHLPVKIAPYPFTTLYPNLSYLMRPDRSRILIADIPGIIENAHLDKGLGFSFLRHIERTSTLLFVIDVSGFEGRDPIADFNTLRNELRAYNPTLLDKPFLVALNKIDIEGADENIASFRTAFPSLSIITLSALNKVGITTLIETLYTLQKNTEESTLVASWPDSSVGRAED